MKKGPIFFLKGAVVLFGLIVLAIYVFAIPRIIGSISLNGYDPILIGIYLPAIPFFIVIYQTLKLLTYISKDKAISNLSVKALEIIKYCAIIISALYVVGLPYIFQVAEKDDAPGVVALGLIFVFIPIVIAVFATVLKNILQNALKK